MNLSTENKFSSILESPWRLKLFFIKNLPMAFLAGLQVPSYDEHHATVSLPYKYLTKNPFRSIYFACQAMAAEFSTGILCLLSLEKFAADISLLVVKVEGTFTKKAVGVVSFTCSDIQELYHVIEESISQNKSQSITLTSTGKDETGDRVAEFKVTWSFKPRK